tara:strand:- start:1294 stop:1569 length:276 start_codon:yes stop_codon:yes gene_type:complete
VSRTVYCVILRRNAEGLDRQPVVGSLGKKIYEQVSKEAWQKWLAHQTMLINEKQLSLIDKEHKAYLTTQMELFFFGKGAEKPEGWVAPDKD